MVRGIINLPQNVFSCTTRTSQWAMGPVQTNCHCRPQLLSLSTPALCSILLINILDVGKMNNTYSSHRHPTVVKVIHREWKSEQWLPPLSCVGDKKNNNWKVKAHKDEGANEVSVNSLIKPAASVLSLFMYSFFNRAVTRHPPRRVLKSLFPCSEALFIAHQRCSLSHEDLISNRVHWVQAFQTTGTT
jgi:hypothetical protein